MGKYMRKRAGRAPAAELAQVVAGVRTRSRSAAASASAVAAAETAPAPKRPRKQTAARGEMEVEVEVEAGLGDGGCAAAGAGCYLQLRSRRLFMAAAAGVRCPVSAAEEKVALPEVARPGASGEPVMLVAGTSRCSSTASSVNVVVEAAAARETSGGAAEAREDRDMESAVSDPECGRQRREATPSSRAPPVDLSDGESSQAAEDDQEHRRHRGPSATVTTAVACRAKMMPPEQEMEEFFAAAEKAEAERFAAKYNFDVARGLPLDAGGRFEWTTVASG